MEIKINEPYIICSAIWFDDGKVYEHQPKNIKFGFVVCGRRHHNIFKSVKILRGDTLELRKRSIQGFLSSDDIFLNRHEAAKVAYKAKQIENIKGELYSEDIY
ncbi:MAG: hypothetical protein ACOC1K_06645 [Nanoarchaeota archaeon]